MRFTFCSTFQKILDWQTSRSFFYWRLKRRLAQDNIVKLLMDAQSTLDHETTIKHLEEWFIEDTASQVRIFT